MKKQGSQSDDFGMSFEIYFLRGQIDKGIAYIKAGLRENPRRFDCLSKLLVNTRNAEQIAEIRVLLPNVILVSPDNVTHRANKSGILTSSAYKDEEFSQTTIISQVSMDAEPNGSVVSPNPISITPEEFKLLKDEHSQGLPLPTEVQNNWEGYIELINEQVVGLSESTEELKKIISLLQSEEGILPKYSKLSLRAKQWVLSKLVWSRLKVSQRELLDILLNENGFTHLKFVECQVLTDSDLTNLLKKNPSLERLHIESCEAVTDSFWGGILPQDALLKSIVLINLPKLRYVGYEGIIGKLLARRYSLPNLEKLVIRECNALIEVNIEATLLKQLEIMGARELKHLHTQSQQLEYLKLIQVPTFAESEWKGIFDLKFIENLREVKREGKSPYAQLMQICPLALTLTWSDDLEENIQVDIRKLGQMLESKRELYVYATVENRKIFLLKLSELWEKLCANRRDSLEMLKSSVLNVKNIINTPNLALLIYVSEPSNTSSIKKDLRKEDKVATKAYYKSLKTESYAIADKKVPAYNAISKAIGYLRGDWWYTDVPCPNSDRWGNFFLERSIFENKLSNANISDLIEALKNNRAYKNKREAIMVLGMLGIASSEVINALIKVLRVRVWDYNMVMRQTRLDQFIGLRTEDWDCTVKAAAKALGMLAESNPEVRNIVIEALINALGDRDVEVRTEAAESLYQLLQCINHTSNKLITEFSLQAILIVPFCSSHSCDFFRNKSIALSNSHTVDDEWYTDDEINLLLSHYFRDLKNTQILTCLQSTNWRGRKVLRNSLIKQKTNSDFDKIHHERGQILIPVNLSNRHWVLVLIQFQQDRPLPDVYYVDLLGHSIDPEVCTDLQHREVFPYVNYQEVILQTDDINCGPWIIEIARYFAHHRHLPSVNEINITEARSQHREDLQLIREAEESSKVSVIK